MPFELYVAETFQKKISFICPKTRRILTAYNVQRTHKIWSNFILNPECPETFSNLVMYPFQILSPFELIKVTKKKKNEKEEEDEKKKLR